LLHPDTLSRFYLENFDHTKTHLSQLIPHFRR
jgi:hypothetical protein